MNRKFWLIMGLVAVLAICLLGAAILMLHEDPTIIRLPLLTPLPSSTIVFAITDQPGLDLQTGTTTPAVVSTRIAVETQYAATLNSQGQ
jgi:hypothetical protein